MKLKKIWDSDDDEVPEGVKGVRIEVECFTDTGTISTASVVLDRDNEWASSILVPAPINDETMWLAVSEESYILPGGEEVKVIDGWADVIGAKICIKPVGGTATSGNGYVLHTMISGDDFYDVTITNKLAYYKLYKSDGVGLWGPDQVHFQTTTTRGIINLEYNESEGYFELPKSAFAATGTSRVLEYLNNGTPRGKLVGRWTISVDEDGRIATVTPEVYIVGATVKASAEVDPLSPTTVWLRNPHETFEAEITKKWVLPDGQTLPEEIQGVTMLLVPVYRINADGTYTRVEKADRSLINGLTLKKEENWTKTVKLTSGYVYWMQELMLEDADGKAVSKALMDRYVTTYADGEGGSSWTIGSDTYVGTKCGIIRDTDAQRSCVVTNKDSLFRVVINWKDEDNAYTSRPEKVIVVLQKQVTNRYGEVVWQDVEGTQRELPDIDTWDGNSYTYTYEDIDYSQREDYRARVRAYYSDGETLFTIQDDSYAFSDMSDGAGKFLCHDTGSADLFRYSVTYDDSVLENKYTQYIDLWLCNRVVAHVEWLDADNRDKIRPDSVTVALQKKCVAVNDDGEEYVTWEDVKVDDKLLCRILSQFADYGGIGQDKCDFDVPYEKDAVYRVCVISGEESDDLISFEDKGTYRETFFPDAADPVVVLTAVKTYRAVKEWDIDLEKLDQPDELAVILQKKTGEKDGKDTWSDPVAAMTLKREKDWTGAFTPVDRYSIKRSSESSKDKNHLVYVEWDKNDPEYRVREISAAKLKSALSGFVEGITDQLPSFIGDFINETVSVDSVLDWVWGKV